MEINSIFNPSSIAVVGASRDATKIGHVIFRNLIEGGFNGNIYGVNPNAYEIIGQPIYPKIADIPGPVDLAIITVPVSAVMQVMRECAEKKVKGAVVITSGFSEVGNVQAEQEVAQIAKDSDIALIGPNCMGLINPSIRMDAVFNPVYKTKRPGPGQIAFMAQSGAIGAAVIDIAAKMGVGVSSFISYGNAAVVNETHLLEYYMDDPKTKIIAVYMEAAKEGRRFYEVAKKVSAQKPIILIKAGKTKGGAKAAMSHTASLAGSYEVYSAAFKQAGIIEVESLTDLFDFSKVFLQPFPKGNRVGIITNGGGIGVLTTDWVETNGLAMAELSDETVQSLRAVMPQHVNITNPLDLAGDADKERYEKALDALLADDNIDSVIVIPFFQTIVLDEKVIPVIEKAAQQKKKPIIGLTIGGTYTEMARAQMEASGIPTYSSPYVATKALAKLLWYAKYREKMEKQNDE